MGMGRQLLELGTRLKTLRFLESFVEYPSIFQFRWNAAQTSPRRGLGQEGRKLQMVNVPTEGRRMSFRITVISSPVVLAWVFPEKQNQ